MKAKDLRTLENLIKEYGFKAGASSYGANRSPTSMGANPSPTLKKPTVSPSTGKGMAKPAQPTPSKVKAKELEVDDVIQQDKKELKVVSPAGRRTFGVDGDEENIVVAKNDRDEVFVFEPESEVETLTQTDEGKLGKLAKSDSSKINLKKHNLRKRIKKLIRKHKLREQGSELIFEINFNNPELAKAALDLPIKCGFEAETSWDNVYGSSEDDDSDWLYEYNWYDIEDFVRDQEGHRGVERLEESYNEWILDKAMEDYESDVVAELVRDREEDEYYLNKYIEDELDESDIEEYKERILDDLPEEDQEEYEDWDFMNWGRQYVEEELLDSYRDWLEEDIRDNGEAMDQAIDNAQGDYDMDRWADYEYGSWQSCLYEHDIYLSNPDYSEGGGQQEVANYLEDWAADNSTSTDVRAGDYHSYAGSDQTYWRVEADSSIQTDGTGSEIISPVYKTPRKMLEELKSLFAWLENQDVDTNSSTGLHVTMSLDSEDTKEINPVKLAVLLGDKYLLSTFGRENNSYAKSQYKNLEKLGNKLKSNPDAKTIEQIENILSDGISRDKFSSINFKSQKDGTTGNQLIEFRIGGGNDYHKDFNKVAKAVIRYATTMQAAYSNKLYNQDYAKALYRLIANVGKISADAEERVKDRINPDVEAPAVDVLKDYFSKDNYVEHLRYLVAAYNTLAEYQRLKNQQNEDVETDGPDADRLQDLLKKAQANFAGAVAQAGYDYNQGHNRATPNAKSIGILRSALKDFELDYDKLSELVNAHQDRIDTGDRRSNLTPKQILGRIKNGVDKLFKKSVVQEPEYLSANQVEKLITGMWNAIQSDEVKDSQEAIKFANLVADASGRSPDFVAGWVDEVRSQSANREFKEFHAKVVRGRYGEGAMFTAGEPVDSKKLKALTDYLKQFPEWNHPVAKGHNPNITGDDSYVDNALSKMMIKMRSRWEHLEDIRQDNPGLYIDSMREIAKLVTDLVDANEVKDHMMGDKYKELLGTDHAQHRDGVQYFGMLDSTAEKLKDVVKGIEQPNTRMLWDDPTAHQLRDVIQNYIRSSYSRYYDMKSREGDGFYRLGPVPEIIKQRTDAIKDFLTGFDKVAQKLGFDSQSSEIANKKQLDQKQADFKKKHGPTHIAKVDGFDFGGNIFVTKRMADSLDNLEDRDLARALKFSSSMHKSDFGDMLVIPNAHYFTALDAEKVLDNTRYKNTWREPIAKALLAKFKSLYGYEFNELDNYYIDINNNNIKQKLKRRNVKFTDKLGDGRIGMGQFAPLLPKDQLESPHGEPFSPSAATAWKVNNPELAKKAEVDDTNATGAPSHLRGLNDFGKARIKFREFDYMMNNGINQYVKDSEKQELVAFLNDYSQVDTATKQAMLKLMIDNVDQQLREPMGISQALVRARPQRESMNTFDKFDRLPLAEQLRILAKVDKKKIDEAWSKKYKDSINCSNPKGFSQKAHCAGKKKNEGWGDSEKRQFKRDELQHELGHEKNNYAVMINGKPWKVVADKSRAQKMVQTLIRKGKDARYAETGMPVSETIEAEQDMAALLTAYGTPKKKKKRKAKVKEGAVPVHNIERDYKTLMGSPILGSDIQAQMFAYFVVPDPAMIRAFREHIAQFGKNTDLRNIFKDFAQAKLHPNAKNKVGITEGKKLTRGDLNYVLDPYKKSRYDAFVNKIKSGTDFVTVDGGTVKLSKELLSDFQNGEIPSKLVTADGQALPWSKLEKTGEFGGAGESASGERKIANRGNTLEGVLGAATVARLATRPGRDVTVQDVKQVIDRFAKTQPPDPSVKSGGGEITFPATQNQITDSFKLTVKLPMGNYTDFVDWEFMVSDSEMAGYIKNVIEYVNDASIVDRFARFFEKNQRPDEVHVIADGVSDMTGRKTDIFMVYLDANGERQIQKFDLSLKAGTTPQFGQASAGADLPTSKLKALSEYGWNAYQKIFGDFGVDVSAVEKQYLNSKTLAEAVNVVYYKAYEQFVKAISGSDDDAEKQWLKTFIRNINEHATYNDPNVQLAQFEKNKYYVLDFKKLNKLLAQDKLDLEVQLKYAQSQDGTKWPKLQFINSENGKMLIGIRAKYSPTKMNNVIEKGPYLKEITKVRGNK